MLRSLRLARTLATESHSEGAAVNRGDFTDAIKPEIPLLLHAARGLTSASDVEDLVQETLSKAYRSWDRFDGRYLRAWLLTILRNTAINAGRKKRPVLGAGAETFASEPDTSLGAQPDEMAVQSDFVATVRRALLELPEHYRSAVELVDMDGLSYQEAADSLGIPVGTMMSRLHRGRRRIRELLGDQGTFEGRRQ